MTTQMRIRRATRRGRGAAERAGAHRRWAKAGVTAASLVAGLAAQPAAAQPADAPGAPPARALVERVNAVADGRQLTRTLHVELIDRSGTVRSRELRVLRKYRDGVEQTLFFVTAPPREADLAFMVFDHPEPERDDEMWLYLPEAREVRRVSDRSRGFYFFGTDLTFEDLKLEGRIGARDYAFERAGEEEVDGHPCQVVDAVPVSTEVATELGYGRVRFWIDAAIPWVRRSEHFDLRGRPLKTIRRREIRRVGGIWTEHVVEVDHHRTGHRTRFTFSDVDYATPIADDVFSPRAMRRGP